MPNYSHSILYAQLFFFFWLLRPTRAGELSILDGSLYVQEMDNKERTQCYLFWTESMATKHLCRVNAIPQKIFTNVYLHAGMGYLKYAYQNDNKIDIRPKQSKQVLNL